VISVAYYALVPPDLMRFAVAGGDAAAADWHSVSGGLGALDLAFDHAEIVAAALARVRERLDTSDVAFELVGRTFSIAELRSVHEVVHGRELDPGNFRRRFQRMMDDGLIEQAPGERITGRRPAKVYRFTGR
jgi:8-oxo-dGTP diphosphatase